MAVKNQSIPNSC